MIFEESHGYALKQNSKHGKTVYALASASRANRQTDDEGNELDQETGVSQETGFHKERGEPWTDALIYGNALTRYIAGKSKGLRVLQASGCRGIGIHDILIIEDN
jgi:hypothetical protein